MACLADLPELVGFFSYSREDDDDSYGALSALRDRIQHELRGQLGRSMKSFRLWQDKEAIAAGKVWESEIKGAVSQAVFFIPIITPTVVRSPYCGYELDSFLAREAALGRDDLVFPILYIRVPALEDGSKLPDDPVLSVIAKRQYVDWRDFRHRDVNSPEVKQAIQRFCANICDALYRSWISPEERKAREEAAALQQAEAERKRQQAEAKRREQELREEAARARERADEERRKREAEAEAERQRAEAEKKKAEAEAERQKAELARRRAEQQPVPKEAETPVHGEEEQRLRPQPPELPTAGQPPELPLVRQLPELLKALPRSYILPLVASLIGVVILGAIGVWLFGPTPVPPIKAGVPLSIAQEQTLKPKDTFQECTNCPQMVVVPAGSFSMGSPDSETGRNTDEGPQHTVTFAKPFAVGKFMVSFDEWDACVADGGCNAYKPDDSGWGRGRQPVINVSSADAKAYIDWLSKKTGKTYRLLSEAEYEYVARAGTSTPFWWGSAISTSQANYDGDYTYANGAKGEFRQHPVPIDSFSPNPWGLYQVDGNVFELTGDCFNKDYSGAPADGSAWTASDCGYRIVRGGAWASEAANLRSASRGEVTDSLRGSGLGFRVARTLAH